jgi:hypothetical protein
MPTKTPNQWPEFKKMPRPKTIRRVIIEEGAGIAERTDGVVTFDVDSMAHDNGGLVHHCALVVPQVAYRYPLLRVVQDHLDYPVTVVADPFPSGAPAKNEAELRKHLGEVFRSEATAKVVHQLLDLVS